MRFKTHAAPASKTHRGPESIFKSPLEQHVLALRAVWPCCLMCLKAWFQRCFLSINTHISSTSPFSPLRTNRAALFHPILSMKVLKNVCDPTNQWAVYPTYDIPEMNACRQQSRPFLSSWRHSLRHWCLGKAITINHTKELPGAGPFWVVFRFLVVSLADYCY